MEKELETIKKQLEDHLEERMTREVKHIRASMDAMFDLIEIREKALNMKLGALVGHDTRKKRQEEPLFTTLEEAQAYVAELQKKAGVTATS